MNSSKLTQGHVYIIGLVVAFVLAIGLFFLMISPVKGQIEDQTKKNSGLLTQLGAPPSATGTAADTARDQAVKKAKLAKQDAETKANLKEAQWAAVIARQSP